MIITESRNINQDVVYVIGAQCDRCYADMRSQWGDFITNGEKNDYQSFNALTLTVNGNYAGVYDGPDVNVMLCPACTKELCAAFPCFKKAMEDPDISQL